MAMKGFLAFFILVSSLSSVLHSCPIPTEGPGETNVSATIAAFNIKIFGPTKASKPDVMAELVNILKRYDIVLIQEIRNKDGTAIAELLDLLNMDPDVQGAYSMEIGPRVGRTSQKEQYCFFYKHALFRVGTSYTYYDVNDVFEREPFNVLFEDVQDNSKQFVLSGLHAKPSDAVAELDFLPNVYDDIQATTGESKVIFLGDFNADCNYVGPNDWSDISLFTDLRFQWYIDNDKDTTVTSTDCAYDRFVVANANGVSVDSAQVFNFEKEHELSNDFALDVSDHYPVEMVLKY